tara:strand:- start:18312 stop:18482 length:171 start_codon:yes stop_codon:yes gene_type:complete
MEADVGSLRLRVNAVTQITAMVGGYTAISVKLIGVQHHKRSFDFWRSNAQLMPSAP